MNPDDHRDQLIDMLLRELVGGETPPDVRSRVLAAAGAAPTPEPVTQYRLPRRSGRTTLPRPAVRSRSPFLAVAALFAVLAAGAGHFYVRMLEQSRTPVLTHVSGAVDHSEGPVPTGGLVRTAAGSTAVLHYPDGTTVELDSETTVQISDRRWRDRSKGLDLVAGRIRADVKTQPSGYPMVLSAGSAIAEVVGTQLAFQHDEMTTRLEVTEGAVRFTPRVGDAQVLVKTGLFAESGSGGFRTGEIHPLPRRGIMRLTLMNADSDEPLREAPLADGEVISLGSLPTLNLNVRADYEGEIPTSVRIEVTRADGQPSGIHESSAKDQVYPPFFAAGDHWKDNRPNDCRAWTPRPGRYHISATAVYAAESGEPLEIHFQITE